MREQRIVEGVVIEPERHNRAAHDDVDTAQRVHRVHGPHQPAPHRGSARVAPDRSIDSGRRAVASAAVASNPALKRLLGASAPNLAAQGIKFLAADPTNGATVNVVVRPAPGGRDSDVAGMADVLKQQYAAAGIGVTNASTISLAGHTALRVALNGVAGPQGKRNEIQEFLAANDLVYVITYAGDSDQFAAIRSTLDVSS